MPANANRTGLLDLVFYAAVGVILLLLMHGGTGLELPGSSASSPSWLGDTESFRASVHGFTGVLVGLMMDQMHELHDSFLQSVGI